jgi:hypothetical protein
MAKAAVLKAAQVSHLHPVTADANEIISFSEPYSVLVSLEGTAPFLFRRWSNEAVEAKSKAAKNSKAKKTDDVESFVYRTPGGNLAIPGEYLRMSIIGAARFRQDPRSPRKSAMDLYKAGIVVIDELADVGKADWDYLDARRVTIQRAGITRIRPALAKGWVAKFTLEVLLPEYISPSDLRDVIVDAGRLVGVGDFRPSFGRFGIQSYMVR